MTALQPPILNLTRLKISSGCPSDFRMSILPHAFCRYFEERGPGERCSPSNDASPGCTSGRGGGDDEEKTAAAHVRRQID